MNTLLILPLTFVFFSVYSQNYVITEYGAYSDSTKLNTQIIQNVIDRAHLEGGGTIVIPKGVFLTGALFFKPNTRLRLQEGAQLKGSDNIADYPLIPSRMEGQNLLYYAALINAYYVDSFSISGPGTINGNALKFWKKFWAHRDSLRKIGKETTNLEVSRPRLVFIWGCDNVIVKDVNLHNSGFWTTHLYQCNNVLIENCDIRSPFKPVAAPSSDGVDIDVCKKVTIRNCYISVNDDGICIKGGKGPTAHKKAENGIVEDVLIENCTFGEVHAVLTMGSESIHARNITMRNCTVNSNRSPILLLKMRPDTYQLFENITVDNITGKSGSIINMSPWRQFFGLKDSTEQPFGTVRNILISNIKVKCKTFGLMNGNSPDKVSNVVFKNINITVEKTGFDNKYTEVKFENVLINGVPN
ncbi:glycosyl hydrolase family 28 protein [Pedobacter sp. P351]|uniref:glycoside hydrolase family 28 protein n=1 Tax=Pedobacter superstes TaxID=3133441 RepID=UPI0030A9487A